MITASATIFMLALVALGARPYRVAPPLPPCEEVPPMAATIYAGELVDWPRVYVAGDSGGNQSLYASREEADTYFQERRSRIEHVKPRLKTTADKLRAFCKTRRRSTFDIMQDALNIQIQEIIRDAAESVQRQPAHCPLCNATLDDSWPGRNYHCGNCKSSVPPNQAR